MPKDLRGVWVATLTPFGADGAVDWTYVRRHLRFLEENGVHGVVPSGTNGEGVSLSLGERKRLIEEVIANKGNLAVVPSTGCASLPETADLSLFAQSVGADVVLIVPPFFYRDVTLEGLLDYFCRLLDQLTVPVLLYNIPMYSGIEVTHELLRGLSGYPHLLGVKDTSGDAEVTAQFVSAFPNLKIFNGTDVLIEATIRACAAGTITGMGNAFPALIVQAYTEAAAGGHVPAQERVRRLWEIYAKYPPFAANKSALSFQGFPKIHVRPPLVDLTTEQEDEFRRELESAGFLKRPTE